MLTDRLEVTSAFTGALLETLEYTKASQLEELLQAAQKAQHKVLPRHQRLDILEKLARGLEEESEAFAQLIAQEGGKPLRDARVEAQRAVSGVRTAIAGLYQGLGREIPMGLTPSSSHHLAFTRRKPLGLVLAISAFNHPLNLLIHQLIPGVAVGCPVIVKPSLKTPLSALKLMALLYACGLPPEYAACILVPDEITSQLAADPRFQLVSFIGSAQVGWKLRQNLAPGTHCLLEHGGTAPCIIAADARVDEHLPSLLRGAYYHAGQVCVSIQNIFIHQSRYEDFAARFTQAAKALKTGDPLNVETDVGPMIRESERRRVQQWTQDALAHGAKAYLLGEESGPSTLSPIILGQAPKASAYFQNEIFGPAVGLYSYQSEESLFQELNQSRFSFQAAFFTQDLDKALAFSEQLEASTVLVNEHTAFRTDWMPFGGYKESGLGVGGILDSFKEYTREKLTLLRSTGVGPV